MNGEKGEIHQVGGQIVHLLIRRGAGSTEYLATIEGGGVCLGNAFSEWAEAERWLDETFGRLFQGHRCGLGCIRMPGAEFLAEQEVLEQLASLSESNPREWRASREKATPPTYRDEGPGGRGGSAAGRF